jgi:hypothetical protein
MTVDRARIALACSVLLLVSAGAALRGSDPPEAAATASVGNDACLPCHADIVRRYAGTAMARTSGPAPGQLIPGKFKHADSGVRYRTTEREGEARLSFERSGEPRLEGSVRLDYYVGSNTRGRTYLYSIDGFVYQSPINYYSAHKLWDMSPGYQHEQEMPLNHPAGPQCLFCHASRIQATTPGTRNRFAGAPFLQNGVGCERCHGPGGAHVRDPGAAARRSEGQRLHTVSSRGALADRAAGTGARRLPAWRSPRRFRDDVRG